MSLILDALRKSEAERRRGKSPDLFAGLPTPTASRRPELLRLWPWFALAALGLVAVSVFWIAREADAPAVVESAQRVAADDQSATMEAPVESPPPAGTTPAPTAQPMQASAPPPAVVPQAAPANAVAAPMPSIPPPPAAVAPTMPEPVAENPAESLPPIAVLTASERASLPPLKLSMHVWDSEPAKRFAIIDGHRLGEGAVVGSGVIEEIRRDGVVLDIGGRRILLPRP
jgi:general secretion pathway protein B